MKSEIPDSNKQDGLYVKGDSIQLQRICRKCGKLRPIPVHRKDCRECWGGFDEEIETPISWWKRIFHR